MGHPLKTSKRVQARATLSSLYVTIALICGISITATPALARALDLNCVISFSIQPQPVESALLAFSKQSQIQVVISPKITGTAESPGLIGAVSARVALDTLLKGTGLKYAATGETVSVTRTAGAFHFDSDVRANESPSGAVALSRESSAAAESASPEHGHATEGVLEQVVVTAQKREERLQDVPVAVTALKSEELRSQNQLRLQDYFAEVPGLLMSISNQSVYQNISIRGITTGAFGIPTVSLTIDDVPLAGAQSAPDLDPSDLAQIEVLRGPQGTLYGASSLGGLIKYVTVNPSTSGIAGFVQAGVSGVYHGAEPGYNFRAAVNVPLSDTFALRASGFTHEDPGYIDNPRYNEEGVNKRTVAGGHLSALWAPNDWASLKLNALYQHEKLDGPTFAEFGSGLGPLQNNDLSGWGGFDRKLQFYSANLRMELGSVALTSVTGYSSNRVFSSLDLSKTLGPATNRAPFFVSGAPLTYPGEINKVSEEIRLSGSLGTRVEWLLGGFYTHENNPLSDNAYYWYAQDPTTLAILGRVAYGLVHTINKEYSGFADITVHLSDRFDVQIGGREAHVSQSVLSVSGGSSVGPQTTATSSAGADANAFTYLLTPRFRISPDLMLYVRLASGYRPGGGNFKVNNGEVYPLQYSPDKTKNYEVGLKTNLMDNRLEITAALYYIDWKNIQLFLQTPKAIAYTGNGGAAKSQGAEFSAAAKPLDNLTVSASVSISDAKLTESLPPPCSKTITTTCSTVVGVSGDRLPQTTRFTGSLSMQQDIPLSARTTAFVGGVLSYVGNRLGEFRGVGVQRADLPGYAKLDLRTGVNYNSWTATIFVNNLTDSRGLLEARFAPANSLFYIQPRTVGLNFSRTF